MTVDGRIVSGLIKAEDKKSVTIQTSDALVIVPKDEIEERTMGDKSMMPDDQLKQFSAHEVRSLVCLPARQRTITDAGNIRKCVDLL